jgi:hypothetical protein
MLSIRVLTALTRDHELPEGVKVRWEEGDREQTLKAEAVFNKYLRDGWMAFSETGKGRRQIFAFDPSLPRIILVPPLGGG